MNRKFEIGDDGSIFSIGDDGTIFRIGKIDSNGNIEGKSKKSNTGWLVFLVFLCVGLGIFAMYLYSEMDGYSNSYYSERNNNSSLREQVNQLQSGKTAEIEKLRNEINSKEYEITNLKSQVPQIYKVISSEAKLYYLTCNEQYVYINCVYKSGTTMNIYATRQNYGLAYHGWVNMSDLSKY
jgi:hypothetical protein